MRNLMIEIREMAPEQCLRALQGYIDDEPDTATQMDWLKITLQRAAALGLESSDVFQSAEALLDER